MRLLFDDLIIFQLKVNKNYEYENNRANASDEYFICKY